MILLMVQLLLRGYELMVVRAPLAIRSVKMTRYNGISCDAFPMTMPRRAKYLIICKAMLRYLRKVA